YRFAGDDANLRRTYALELVAKAPDVIVAGSLPVAQALKQATTTIPIVISSGGDPVFSGLVSSLAHPGGNVTGFAGLDPSIGGKWVELLKELAPGAKRIGVVIARENPLRADFMHAAMDAAQRYMIELATLDVVGDARIEAAIDRFAGAPNGALLVFPG